MQSNASSDNSLPNCCPIGFLWPIFDVGIPGMAAGKKKSTDPLIIFLEITEKVSLALFPSKNKVNQNLDLQDQFLTMAVEKLSMTA